MPVSAADLYAFHTRPETLARLLPPWEGLQIVLPPSSLAAGTRVVLRQWLGPLPVAIESVHRTCTPGVSFVDEMVRGPFARWVHEHRFEHVSATTSWLVDDVDYELPLKPLSLAVEWLVTRRITRMFAFRHEVTLAAMNELAASR
jgi:uncharacterized protein